MVICLFITEIAFSQWVQTEGPTGAITIKGIFENKGKLYIGTDSGLLYKSDSISGSWDYMNSIYSNVYAKKGDSLLIGTTGGIKVLDLSSPNIKPVSYGQYMTNSNIKAINQTDTCLYVGLLYDGFCKSKGFSDKWEEFNNGLPFILLDGVFRSRDVYSIAHLSDVIFCTTEFGLFKTNVSPILWSPAISGIPKEVNNPHDIKFLKAIDETIFVGIQNKLYSSSNKGNSWEETYSFGSTVSSLNEFVDDYYVTTLGNGIYISKDKGVSWSNINSGLSDLNVTTLTMIDTVLACGTSSNGFYYKSGNVWINNNRGIIYSSIKSMAATSKAIIANDEQKVYSSTDGNSWTDITPPDSKKYFGSVATMGDTFWLSGKNDAISGPNDDNFIIYSEDDGISWKNPNHGVPFERGAIFSMYISDKTLYAYIYEEMCATNDLGLDWWYNLSLPSQYCNNFNGFVVYNSIPFAISCGYAELLKCNSEGNWILSNTGLPADLKLDYLTKTSDALYVNVNGRGFYVSKDNGNSWSFTSNTIDLDHGINSSTFNGHILFISTPNGVFYTDDYGQNWKSVNIGLSNKVGISIKIFNNTLFLATSKTGIWKYDIKDIVSSNLESNLNKDQPKIYPNPTSGYLNVQTDSNKGFEFKIVDLMGKQILSTHQLSDGRIDISILQNGTYIIILNSNEGVFTEKLIINR